MFAAVETDRHRILQRLGCFETMYSHRSKIICVGHAKALGYQVIMVMIHLQSPSLNQARISERVREGGHDVADKAVSRIPRMRNHVQTALPL